jgi:uncharacterized delta-60 repeat protein
MASNNTFRLAAIAAAISLLTACGGGGSDSPDDGGTPPPTSSPAPSPEPSPSPSPEPSPSPAPTPSPTPDPAPPSSGSGFVVSLPNDKAVVFQGATASVRIAVERQAGFDGAVSVRLVGLPTGVSAAAAIVPPGATSVDVTLAAEGAAPHSLPTAVSVEASATMADGAVQLSVRALTVTVRGVAGMVDTSFAGGAVLTRVGSSEDYAQAAAVQADGNVLVAGSTATNAGTQIAVVRYLRDGSLDTSFGTDGRAVVAVGARDDQAKAIAVHADGKIVVAGITNQGTAGYDFALVRLLPSGAVDSGFGTNGRVVTDFGGDSDRAFAVLVMPDGRIVAGGQTNEHSASSGVDFALARYMADGSLDTSFGAAGKVIAPILPSSTGDVVRGLALQTVNGTSRILAVGGDGDFTAARFTDNGALDGSFGVNGKVSGLFGVNIGSAYAVTTTPSGEALIAGHVGHDYAAVKLTLDGQLDPSFGPARDGRFRHAMSAANWDEATAIVRQADGKVILGGWVYTGNSTSGDFGTLRLNEDGTLDAGFGSGGTMQRAVADGTKTDLGRAIVLQPDERIPSVRAIVAGEAQDTNRDFALMRLWL